MIFPDTFATFTLLLMATSYIEGLDTKTRERYTNRLSVVGIEGCPYRIPGDKWINDPKGRPEVQYPDIYHYLIDNPGW